MSEGSRLARRDQRRRTPLPDHGTRRRYKLGCRCLPCRAANATYVAAWARGEHRAHARVSAAPAKRRIQQMQIEGFTLAQIAADLGVSQLRPLGAFVTRKRAAEIEALYQRRVAS